MTVLLVCVSPAASQTLETISSLEFAARAMCVEVNLKVNTGERCTSARQWLSHRAEQDAEQSLKCMQDKVAKLEQSLDVTRGEALQLQQALARAEFRADQFQALADTRAEEARRAEERAVAAETSLEAVRHDSDQQKHAFEARLNLLQVEIDSMRFEWASRTTTHQRDCDAHVRCNRLYKPTPQQQQ